MTSPSLTYGHGMLEEFDSLAYTTSGTADSGTTTYTIDAERTDGDDYWNGHYIKFTSGDNIGLTRKVTDFVAADDKLIHDAFPNAVATGDKYLLSDWIESESSLTATLTVEHGDIFKIEATCDDAGDEYVIYQRNISNISSDTYTKYLLRWKTSHGSDGLGAVVKLIFTDGSQTILGATNPEFSTTWKVTSGTITAGKTIDKIEVWANDYPNSIDSGTYYVCYDFLLLHKGTFEIPFVDDVQLELENRYADIAIPGRLGDITQYLGAPSPTIRLSGKIDIGASNDWGEPILEFLYRIWQDAHKEPWQWFSTGGLTDDDRIINCKVTLRKFPFIENKEATRNWSLELKHYSLSSGDEATWANMQWLGI